MYISTENFCTIRAIYDEFARYLNGERRRSLRVGSSIIDWKGLPFHWGTHFINFQGRIGPLNLGRRKGGLGIRRKVGLRKLEGVGPEGFN